MIKKTANILLLLLQIFLTISLAIYLLVPKYNFDKHIYSSQEVIDPYLNWNSTSFQKANLQLPFYSCEGSDRELHPFYGIDGLYHMQPYSIEENPFIFGNSIDDIQFLINSKDSADRIIADATQLETFQALEGINVIAINNEKDLDLLDARLKKGSPSNIMLKRSGNKDKHTNLILTDGNETTELDKALLSGNNLLLIDKGLESDSLMAVIRELRWSNDEIYLDLSQKGRIKLLGRSISIDTLSQNLRVRLPNIDYFRFEVIFEKEGLHYISNPYYRKTDVSGGIKAKNQPTIFLNLGWFIAIIIMNLLMIRIRKRITS